MTRLLLHSVSGVNLLASIAGARYWIGALCNVIDPLLIPARNSKRSFTEQPRTPYLFARYSNLSSTGVSDIVGSSQRE